MYHTCKKLVSALVGACQFFLHFLTYHNTPITSIITSKSADASAKRPQFVRKKKCLKTCQPRGFEAYFDGVIGTQHPIGGS